MAWTARNGGQSLLPSRRSVRILLHLVLGLLALSRRSGAAGLEFFLSCILFCFQLPLDSFLFLFFESALLFFGSLRPSSRFAVELLGLL